MKLQSACTVALAKVAVGIECSNNYEAGYCSLKGRYYVPYRQSCAKYIACPDTALIHQHICVCPHGLMYDPTTGNRLDFPTRPD